MFELYSDTAIGVGEGYIDLDEFAEVSDTFRDSLATHRDYFRGTTPPPQFQETHDMMLEACGGRATTTSHWLQEAQEFVIEGAELIQEAASALPDE